MCKKWVLVAFVVVLLGPIAALASSPYDRVAYWDDNYPTHWVAEATTVEVRDALEAAGYTVMDADELKTWMDARIADGKLSVVVFCKDVAPETVVETNDETCTLRQYLNAGGKVVFYGDIPFYNQGNPGGGETNWGGNGSVGILGFNASPSGGWDSNQEVTITEEGVAWGLTETWVSVRPGAPDGWENMTFLAMDNNGNVPAYVAHYLPDDTFRGFVRIWDRSSITIVEDLIRVAEYAENVEVAALPVPESDSTDVMRDVVLSWASGSLAASHDVYFGTSFEDVNAATRENPLGVLVSQSQTGNTYDPEGLLEFGTTYYWRIDEVNSAPDYTIFRGAVWNFTAEPFAYPIENVVVTTNAIYEADAGPENTINGSGLNADDQHSIDSSDMFLGRAPGDDLIYLQYEFDGVYKLYELLVWNYNVQFELLLGFGIQNVTVEYSGNGTDWISLGDVDLNQGTTKPTYTANTTIDFGGVAAKYVKLTVNSGFGGMGQYGLSELRFTHIPAQAREPEPADGAANVDVASTLAWRAGRDSVSHEVYLGTDPEALALAGTVEAPSFAPGALDLGVTYYWQITEVQETEAWAGPVWSFSAQSYLVVDDFESYNDEDNLIYEAWLDGWVNDTGSTVGYLEEPFAEQTLVHSGRQSMPLSYDNAGGIVSEADLELAQNWTTNGIKGLSLYFYGDVDNTAAQLYARINNTRVNYAGSSADLTDPNWHHWSIDLATVGNVSNVRSLTIGIEGSGAKGILYIDDIRLYPYAVDYLAVDITGVGDTVQGVPNDGDWPAAETPDLAIDDNTATKFLHFKGFSQPTGIQVTPAAGASIVTGLSFTTANDAPARDPVAFELYGSNDSIDGPYTLIASGAIVDFAGATAWPRYTKNETPITFDNSAAYTHYQVLLTAVRDPASANSMQIAEIELLGE